MAHFAKLDDNNNVLEVIVVDNSIAVDEAAGITFLTDLLGYSNWKQCSYNGTIRTRFPGPGYMYNGTYDAFIMPQPYPSWTLDTTTLDWVPPVAKPTDGGKYKWDEGSLSWVNII